MTIANQYRSFTIRIPEPDYAVLVERARADGDRSVNSMVRALLAPELRSDSRIKPDGSADKFEAR